MQFKNKMDCSNYVEIRHLLTFCYHCKFFIHFYKCVQQECMQVNTINTVPATRLLAWYYQANLTVIDS